MEGSKRRMKKSQTNFTLGKNFCSWLLLLGFLPILPTDEKNSAEFTTREFTIWWDFCRFYQQSDWREGSSLPFRYACASLTTLYLPLSHYPHSTSALIPTVFNIHTFFSLLFTFTGCHLLLFQVQFLLHWWIKMQCFRISNRLGFLTRITCYIEKFCFP